MKTLKRRSWSPNSLVNYNDHRSLVFKLRSKRAMHLQELINFVYERKGSVSIIDIGGTEEYWNIIPREFLTNRKVKITIVNLPGSADERENELFSFIEGDGCDLSMAAASQFDISHSNSVVEHVGDWNRMILYAKEVLRVSDYYFVQTPNYWFPVEPHCMTPLFHWLPKPIRVWLVMHFRLGYYPRASNIDEAVKTVNGSRLLNKKMFHFLFSDGEILTEWFFGLPKSFIATNWRN